MSAKGKPGSVSSGTLRSRDLIEAFLSELEDLDPDWASNEEASLIEDIYNAVMAEEDVEEILTAKVATLTDTLDQFSPDGHHFGAHEGDGADFGFWPNEEEDDE